jgi:hypothetical protein
MNRALVWAATAAILLVLVRPVAAQNAAFDAAWNAGVDAWNLGKYADARREFMKARTLDQKNPGPYRYLAKIDRRDSQWQDCVANATEFVKLNAGSKHAPTVRQDLAFCRDKLGLPPLTATLATGQGALGVRCNVEGASVAVDGLKKGGTPLAPVPLVRGKHTVRIEAEGWIATEVEVEIIETIPVDLACDLAPDPTAKPRDPLKPADTQASSVTVGWIILEVTGVDRKAVSVTIDGAAPRYADDGTIEAQPGNHLIEITAPGYASYTDIVLVARAQKRAFRVDLRTEAGLSSSRTWGYVFVGVAALAAGSGFVLTQMSASKYEQAGDWLEQERTRPIMGVVSPSIPEGTVRTHEEIAALRDDGDKLSNLSLLSYGAAAVALGVAVYFFIDARDEHTRERVLPRFQPTIVPGPSGGVVGGGLVFTQELDW